MPLDRPPLQIDAHVPITSRTTFHLSALQSLTETLFGDASKNAGSVDIGSDVSKWFNCVLCSSGIEGDDKQFQAPASPIAKSEVPDKVQIYADVFKASIISPFDVAATVVQRSPAASDDGQWQTSLGFVRSWKEGIGIADFMGGLRSPEKRRIEATAAFLGANHTAQLPKSTSPAHSRDLTATVAYNGLWVPEPSPLPKVVPAVHAANTFVNYGWHDGGGASATVVEELRYEAAHASDPEPMAVAGSAHDYAVRFGYRLRGNGFRPPDVADDPLLGTHGFIGTAEYLFPLSKTRLSKLTVNGFSFSNQNPVDQSLRGALELPLSAHGLSLAFRGSRGTTTAAVVAPSLSFASLSSSLGGAAQALIQSVGGADISLRRSLAGGALSFGLSAGYGNSVNPTCPTTTTCATNRRKQYTYAAFVEGPHGFVAGSSFPSRALAPFAPLADVFSGGANSTQDATDLVNRTHWSFDAGLRIPSMTVSCNSLVGHIENKPPEALDVKPTERGLQESIYLELVPLRDYTSPSSGNALQNVAFLIGASHSITADAQQRFASTLTYETKVVIGSPLFGYHAQGACGKRKLKDG